MTAPTKSLMQETRRSHASGTCGARSRNDPDTIRSDAGPTRGVDRRCASATETELPEASLDAVLTDPPYYANVQYAELMDFCYAWLRRLVGDDDPVFAAPSTRRAGDLTGNQTLERGLE